MKKLFTLSFLLLGTILFSNAQLFKPGKKGIEKRITPVLEYLASDELEGRLTGTENERKAGRYLADQFTMLQVPGAFNGDYFQEFEFNKLPVIRESAFELNGIKLIPGEDFYPLSQSGNCMDLSLECLKVGYGITAKKIGHDDYDSVDFSGYAVLVELGNPEIRNPHSKYAEYSSVTNKVNYALNSGCSAIVFYGTSDEVKEPSEKMSRNLKAAGIPVIYITKSGLEKIDLNQDFLQCTLSIEIERQRAVARNVAAVIDNGSKHTVVIGAHYDHLGFGEEGGSRWMGHPEIHNGADDNASGTAALLEFARYLRKGKYGNNNYLIVAFSGEELGLLGSKHLVKNLPKGFGDISYMLNMDMIGRLDEEKSLGINGVGSSSNFEEVINSLKSKFEVKTTKSGIGSSDHTSFYLDSIPAIHFFTGTHEDYHKPGDDADKINFYGEALIVRYMLDMIKNLDSPDKLPYQKTDEGDGGRRSMNFNVTLGIMPAYFYEGEGLKIDGVRENKPAQLAGMAKDDIILQMGEIKISDIRDYMSALSNFKKGDSTIVKIKRGSETLHLKVTF